MAMPPMEFWGVEVKAGEPFTVEEFDQEELMIHISQAALGEGKKSEAVVISVKVEEKKYVLGTLSADKFPHMTFDLMFDKPFELSHNWKHGSVYFTGYKSFAPEEYDEFDSSDESESDDEVVPTLVENGKLEAKANKAKPISVKTKPESSVSATKGKVTIVEPKKEDDSEDSDDDSEDSDDDSAKLLGVSSTDDDSDDPMDGGSDDDDDSSEEDEAAPPTKEKSKKRAPEPVTPASGKKAKLVTPQKTSGSAKKGSVHVDTPHPKKSGKTPGNNDKAKTQTPKSAKSAGDVVCTDCSKSFKSDGALQSHSKAKHGK